MQNYLNVGIIQNTGNPYYEPSMEHLKKNVAGVMGSMNRPDVVVGTEMSLGLRWDNGLPGDADPSKIYDTIPGKLTEELSLVAKEYRIYFIPGSMYECKIEDGKERIYNSMPIFGPDGSLLHVYRKMCPYYPVEAVVTKGEEYVILDIPEKDIKLGIMNCHDMNFPEVSRNLTLMGAEMLIRPAVDPEGLYNLCKTIPVTRAVENQAYFLSLNMTGEMLGMYAYGHSILAGPDGNIIYEAGKNEVYLSVALDFDVIKNARQNGTFNTEQFLRQLPLFAPPMPFAEDVGKAPLYRELDPPDITLKQRAETLKKRGVIK